jgi:two-component system, NarL family, nitrate/nitrite response regulator NarL
MNKSATSNVRLLLIDDHVLFRESFARLLQSETGFEVVGHCGSVAETSRILKSHEIDLVLLDLDLGAEKGTDVLDMLRDTNFQGKVLLVTADVNESQVSDFIRKGVFGIFLKHNSPALLVQGIRDVMEGRACFQQELLKRAMESGKTQEASPGPAVLTDREREVLSLIFEGFSNKEIAHRLRISESAVKGCLQQLFTKTHVRTRGQLVRVALEQYRNQL